MALPAVIQFPRTPGRPSNAALQLEVRGLRAAIADLTEERDELAEELAAYLTERVAVASQNLALARRGQVLVAAGHRPTQQLMDIERLALREQVRARSMRTGPEAA